ncbi:pupal cuticle protein-like [Fopius arisanus]|uniref:PCP_0 protein n=1 Tax=Fopius arisanus TaxID=64838 RepID=A0A0C9PXX7_9HYME|nr:PREDICTED: pupal cuticle protein-like [Fopius arisanus]
MTIFLVIFSLLIALTSGSFGHIGFYGYHGPFAPLSSDGRVIETPEVAHARAAHLSAYASALSSYHSKEEMRNDESVENDNSSESKEEQTGAHDPAPLGEDGRVVDTIEVARAKAAHLATHAEAVKKIAAAYPEAAIVWEDDTDANHLLLVPSHVTHTIPHKTSAYRGPSAPLASDGTVIDTKEVAEAKAAHFRVHAAALAEVQRINDNCHC